MKNKSVDYRTILENIDGLVAVDRDGTILVMEDVLARACYVNGEQMDGEKVIGRNIMEVIPTTNIMSCFSQKDVQVADYYFVEGRTIVSTRKPIFINGEAVAALEYDLFGVEGEHLTDFLERTSMLSKTLSELKNNVFSLSKAKYTINSIVGNSEAINRVKEEIRIASRYNSTVLIEGETGTGKELVAHSIHSLSERQLAPFIKLNCAAIPENLLESELFGYEEGSFTGGKKGGKRGKIEQANGGTIFLDEINQLPLSEQPKLLRVLQEREVNPIGSEKNIPVDVRVIATSNEDLQAMVEDGRFREDLYYRLNVINIRIPSLAERREDIPEIVDRLVHRFNWEQGKHVERVSQAALNALKNFGWPGNIRQLNNVIERAMNHCEGDILKTNHFKEAFMDHYMGGRMPAEEGAEESLEEIRDRAERRAIVDALINHRGNKVKAADALRISRSLIHKKIKKFQIKEDEYESKYVKKYT